MPLQRTGRSRAVDMAIVRDQIERFQGRARRVAAMHRLALVTDDDVFHDPPDHVVEDGHAQKREAVRPGNEDRSENDQCDSRPAVKVFLEVQLFVTAGSAALDDGSGRRGGDRVRRIANCARLRRLTRLSSEPGLAVGAEKVDAGHLGN